MKVVTVVGARPQFIKAAMVSHVLRKDHQGQHRTNSAKNVCLVAIDKKHSPPLIFLRRGKPN